MSSLRHATRLALITTLTVLMAATTTNASASTLFNDDFEDGNLTGWSSIGDGDWSVIQEDTLAVNLYLTPSNARLYAGTPNWASYTVTVRVKPYTFSVDGTIGLLARAGGPSKYYRLAILEGRQVALQAVNGNNVTTLASAAYTIDTVVWHTLALEVNGTTIRGIVNGVPLLEATDNIISTGQIGLQAMFATASFDDVTVTSLAAR